MGSYFQRQLRTENGLETLQNGMKDEAKRFKNFWIRELPESHLYEDRIKFGPYGMKASQAQQKKVEAFMASHQLGLTEDGLERTGTKKDSFNYFGTPIQSDQPSLG